MAAGQGFKTFTTGEVLTAADVNGYLMQGVGVFTDAANRDAEITSPQEGQFAYLKDTNVTTYYTGSAWANLDTTGMTNPMTTTGDTIYSSSGSTPARLGIGSTGQVLTVSGGLPSWATPATPSAGANWSLLNSGGTSLTGTDLVTISGISGQDKIMVVIRGASSLSSASTIGIRLNTEIVDYWGVGFRDTNFSSYSATNSVAYNLDEYQIPVGKTSNSAGSAVSGYFLLTGGASSGVKVWQAAGGVDDTGTNGQFYTIGGTWSNSATVSSVSIRSTSNNFDAGTVFVYGSA